MNRLSLRSALSAHKDIRRRLDGQISCRGHWRACQDCRSGGGLLPDTLSRAVQAARAPLLVAVLRGYRSICGEAWQAELRSVFPHLTHLICSAQPSVRTALADLLQAQIPKMIA